MIKNILLHFALILFLQLNLSAQNPYYFTIDSGTYTDLIDATSANNNTIWDDPNYTFPLGFTFEIFGVSSENLYMNEFVGAVFSIEDASNGSSPLLMPYGSDIADLGLMGVESLSPISYKTEGTAGSKIFKAEWKNAGFYNELDLLGTDNNFVNFQVWIYEGTNTMEVHFGPNNIVDFELIHDLSGPFIGYMDNFSFSEFEYDNIWYLSGDPLSPEIDSIVAVEPNNLLTGTVPEGTIYRFTTSPPTSVQNPSIENEVKLYPSIVQNDFTVKFLNSSFQDAKIQLFDSYGKLVNQLQATNQIETVNTQSLKPGVYFVHIKTKNGEVVKKIVKQFF